MTELTTKCCFLPEKHFFVSLFSLSALIIFQSREGNRAGGFH